MGIYQILYSFSVLFVFLFTSGELYSASQKEMSTAINDHHSESSSQFIDIQETHPSIEEAVAEREESIEINSVEVEAKQSLAGFVELETAPLFQQAFAEEITEVIETHPIAEQTIGLTAMASFPFLEPSNDRQNTIPLIDQEGSDNHSFHAETSIVPISSSNENPAGQVMTPAGTPADLANLAAYDSLLISEEEKQIIGKILTTMAQNNLLNLWFQRKELEHLGMRIRRVHPIRFLGTVFSNPYLVRAMNDISESKFKWDGFIEGFSERLKEEVHANNVHAYLPGLANHVEINVQIIRNYIDDRDYKGLVLFLIHTKLPRR